MNMHHRLRRGFPSCALAGVGKLFRQLKPRLGFESNSGQVQGLRQIAFVGLGHHGTVPSSRAQSTDYIRLMKRCALNSERGQSWPK